MELAPGFRAPTPGPLSHLLHHVDKMPDESPVLFGLHPNAEIKYLTAEADTLFSTLRRIRSSHSGDVEGQNQREARLRDMVDDLLHKVPEAFNMMEVRCPPVMYWNGRTPQEEGG